MIGLAHIRAGVSGVAAPPFGISFVGGAMDPRVSFARASHGMSFDATGRLTYAPNNLALNSVFAGAASGATGTMPTSWTNAGAVGTLTVTPDAAGGGNRLRVAASASRYIVRQTVNVSANTRYVFSVVVDVLASVIVGNLIDVRNVPAGTALAYYQNGALSTYSSLVPVGKKTLHIVADIGASGGSLNLNFGYGVANGATGEAIFEAPQFEAVTYQAQPRSYLPTAGAPVYGPRFDHDPGSLAPLGLLCEPARVNAVLRNRDLAHAAWIKTGMTAARDQAGVDGVANSASRIAASAANGTCLQSIALASSARFQTAFVKRIAGVGEAAMTMDGGASWTTIPVGPGWTRVAMPARTLANPTVGFRLATSGDAIAVDFVQNEDGAYATGPIATDASAGARAGSVVKFTPPAGVAAVRFTLADNSTQDAVVTPGVEYTVPAAFGRSVKSLARA
ncbi:MAG: hypothetical protein JWN93_245 [Hyphomicrobiales bacterium]|nr:hypothetical protein [Hyphomicrobiales bacterium]